MIAVKAKCGLSSPQLKMSLTNMIGFSTGWRSILLWMNLSTHQELLRDSVTSTGTALQHVMILHPLKNLEKLTTNMLQLARCHQLFHLHKLAHKTTDTFRTSLKKMLRHPSYHRYRQKIVSQLLFPLSPALLTMRHTLMGGPAVRCIHFLRHQMI